MSQWKSSCPSFPLAISDTDLKVQLKIIAARKLPDPELTAFTLPSLGLPQTLYLCWYVEAATHGCHFRSHLPCYVLLSERAQTPCALVPLCLHVPAHSLESCKPYCQRMNGVILQTNLPGDFVRPEGPYLQVLLYQAPLQLPPITTVSAVRSACFLALGRFHGNIPQLVWRLKFNPHLKRLVNYVLSGYV